MTYGRCPICRTEGDLARVGICFVCAQRAHWVRTLPTLPPYLLQHSEWSRLLAYVGLDNPMTGLTSLGN